MDMMYLYWTLTISWAETGIEYTTIAYTSAEECFYKADFFSRMDVEHMFDYMCSFTPLIGVVL